MYGYGTLQYGDKLVMPVISIRTGNGEILITAHVSSYSHDDLPDDEDISIVWRDDERNIICVSKAKGSMFDDARLANASMTATWSIELSILMND